MAEVNTGSSAVQPGTSGTLQGGVGDPSNGEPAVKVETKIENEPQPKVVPLDVHKQALGRYHTAQARVEELEKKQSDGEAERLKKNENYKGLWEREQQRAEKAEEKANKATELYVNTQRYEKFLECAVKQGLRPEAVKDLSLLDLSDLVVEATSEGRFIVNGVEARVEQEKNLRSHWWQKATVPPINPAGGGATPPGNGKITVTDVRNAEKRAKARIIPMSEYEDALKRYDKQQKEAQQKQ